MAQIERILVAGGAGFLGSHFLDHLLATTAERVVCLDNFNSYYDPTLKRGNVAALFGNARAVLIRGDFCDEGEMIDALETHEVRRVMHLGGYETYQAVQIMVPALRERGLLLTSVSDLLN